MPICLCFTSLEESKIPDGFECRLSAMVAELFSKPEERFNVIVSPNQKICKAGSCQPAVLLQIRAIGQFDAEKNSNYFTALFDFLKKELDLPEKRMTIEFVDVEAHMARGGK